MKTDKLEIDKAIKIESDFKNALSEATNYSNNLTTSERATMPFNLAIASLIDRIFDKYKYDLFPEIFPSLSDNTENSVMSGTASELNKAAESNEAVMDYLKNKITYLSVDKWNNRCVAMIFKIIDMPERKNKININDIFSESFQNQIPSSFVLPLLKISHFSNQDGWANWDIENFSNDTVETIRSIIHQHLQQSGVDGRIYYVMPQPDKKELETEETNTVCESDGKEFEFGDFVPLVHLIEKLRKNSKEVCTMNDLIFEVKKKFNGIEGIKNIKETDDTANRKITKLTDNRL